MKQKTSEQLKETLCRYLDDMASKDLNSTTLDQIHKLSDTLKNVLKIEMLEEESGEGEYSERSYGGSSRGRYSRDGGYSEYNDSGYSGARRGQRYVRGYYRRGSSYDGGEMSNYSRDGRYSYAEAKDDMIAQMRELANNAEGKDRESIMRCISQMENA